VISVRQIAAVSGTEVIQVTPGTSPEAKATSDLISTLRNDTIPAAAHGTTLRVYIGGVTLAILFGLSMDYQVFLVSRMNEEWVHGRRNSDAVRTGQVETARVITAAATIMICVFLTFSFLGQRDVAEFGIGLAAAVALDAFILRTVLVPAAMHLFGNANWWLPRWLDRRLPHLAIEPPDSAGEPTRPPMPAIR